MESSPVTSKSDKRKEKFRLEREKKDLEDKKTEKKRKDDERKDADRERERVKRAEQNQARIDADAARLADRQERRDKGAHARSAKETKKQAALFLQKQSAVIPVPPAPHATPPLTNRNKPKVDKTPVKKPAKRSKLSEPLPIPFKARLKTEPITVDSSVDGVCNVFIYALFD